MYRTENRLLFTMFAAGFALMCTTAPVRAFDTHGESYLGSICLFAGNYAPEGWAFCDGSILPINQNCALFSLLDTTYGGDGRTTFALPDLRGRVPVGYGAGPGLSFCQFGQTGGAETVVLSPQQVQLNVDTLALDDETADPEGTAALAITNPANVAGAQSASLGDTQAHDNRQPGFALNYIICLNGYYPCRN